MSTLIIDTSTDRGIVVFAEGETVLLAQELPFGHRSSTYLMPSIKEGFDKLKLKVGDLSSVAVGVGPGSYTGIRVGVAVAKAIAFAKNLPLIGFSGLHALAVEPKTLALLDAKISGFYFAKDGKIGISSLENIDDLLEGIETVITTNTIAKLDMPQEVKGLDAEKLAVMAQDKLNRGEYTLDGYLELLYLRVTQAEENKSV
jgi:tRNA threonylcarbamoyladenosine biosynthesis protein TsaB